MTISAASSVAFAVAGGSPADAREWITVDLVGHPNPGRRGYLVATEPLIRTGRSLELARHARALILDELRHLRQSPPDVALGRAFAAANGSILEQVRTTLNGPPEERILIGVTAVIFEEQTATVAVVSPGQFILVQDGLIYAVPELESWFPGYAPNEIREGEREPLGFANYTAPLIVETEVRSGDTIIVTTSATGQAFAEEVAASGLMLRDLGYLHHRDPDVVLDAFKGVVIARDLQVSGAAVVSFPPLPDGAQVETLADIRRRAGDRWHHGRAVMRQLRPARVPRPVRAAVDSSVDATSQSEPIDASPEGYEAPARPRHRLRRRDTGAMVTQGVERLQARGQRMADWSGPKWRRTWESPSPVQQFGLPGAHGVRVFRGQASYMGERGWRQSLPRLPIIGSAWIWPVLVLMIAGLVFGAMTARDRWLVVEVDEESLIASIDSQIVAAEEADDSTAERRLLSAQTQIDDARDQGVAADLLDPRQAAVTSRLDEVTDVVRVSDVQRVGTLPDEFSGGPMQGVNTPAGIFFAAGDLFQWRADENADPRTINVILREGQVINGVTVGALNGVAYDALGLYATDGRYVFILAPESQAWRPVELGRINDLAWDTSQIGAFDGSIYLLQPDGRQIYRFDIAGSETIAQPLDWLQSGARDQINFSADMAIDVNIFVAIEPANDDDADEAGMVHVLRQGELEDSLAPPYLEAGKVTTIVTGAATGYLYVVVSDGENSRIVAFDREGANAFQLRLPNGFTTGSADVRAPFDGVREVVIDEATGTVYIVNADGVWTARYSPPDVPATTPDGTEPATPAAE